MAIGEGLQRLGWSNAGRTNRKRSFAIGIRPGILRRTLVGLGAGLVLCVCATGAALRIAEGMGELARLEQAPVVWVVVRPGETLWEIAARHAAGADVRDMLARIRRLNHLESALVRPGQALQVPAGSKT